MTQLLISILIFVSYIHVWYNIAVSLSINNVLSTWHRGAGFGAALVLTHLEHYHDPNDNTKVFFKYLHLLWTG